jgi:cell division protein FtsZ
VQGISDLITHPGIINIDFADVKTTMEGQGDAIMGIGTGEGDNRACDAATGAINNPLLEDSRIEGANHILINITGNEDMTLMEVEEIVKIVTANADPDALIIYGTATDNTLGDKLSVTVIATGFIPAGYQVAIDRSAVSARSEKSKVSDSGDFMTGSEWRQLSERGQKNVSGLGTRNGTAPVTQPVITPRSGDDLDTPTVMRMQQQKAPN